MCWKVENHTSDDLSVLPKDLAVGLWFTLQLFAEVHMHRRYVNLFS
jgi:hypothetical protein